MSPPRKPVHPRLAASGATGSAVVLVVFLAQQFGVHVPPDVAAALTVVVGFAAGYARTL